MEREIKFRAFNGEHMSENSTLYDLYLQDGEFHFVDDENDISKECPEGEGIEVMQYTGLKDKNGKEIYEGDILGNFEVHKDYMPSNMPEHIEIYWFDEEYAYWGRETIKTKEDYDYDLSWTNWYDFEVLGNIYENPNLILDNK